RPPASGASLPPPRPRRGERIHSPSSASRGATHAAGRGRSNRTNSTALLLLWARVGPFPGRPGYLSNLEPRDSASPGNPGHHHAVVPPPLCARRPRVGTPKYPTSFTRPDPIYQNFIHTM